jgi:A/G-specific adenine glycosylase
MLQQTQTERVIPFWKRWLLRWPSPEAFADALFEEALREWIGLGYNRRCRNLWECARRIVDKFAGEVPRTPEELITLPGIGHYTAGAVACFAYNYPSVFIETNIRAAVLDFFFTGYGNVKDNEFTMILEDALDRENPRKWYWALMDYGAALKKNTVNPNRRSAHYVRQSRFEGSFRQRRSLVLRTIISDGAADADELCRRTGLVAVELARVTASLEKDRLVCCRNGMYMTP